MAKRFKVFYAEENKKANQPTWLTEVPEEKAGVVYVGQDIVLDLGCPFCDLVSLRNTFLVRSSENVGTMYNSTSAKVAKVVQFSTDESTQGLKIARNFATRGKLTGSVEVGTKSYVYDMK